MRDKFGPRKMLDPVIARITARNIQGPPGSNPKWCFGF